jgi:hypothetical protein
MVTSAPLPQLASVGLWSSLGSSHLFRFPPWSLLLLSGRPGPGLQLGGGGHLGANWGRSGPGRLAGQSCDSWAWRIPPSLPARLPHKAAIVQENPAIVSCLCPPPAQGLPPPQSRRQQLRPRPGVCEVGCQAQRLRAPCLPFTTIQTLGGKQGNLVGDVGEQSLCLPLQKPLHPQLFPPLQAAGLGRE